jgi:hypothetical protein
MRLSYGTNQTPPTLFPIERQIALAPFKSVIVAQWVDMALRTAERRLSLAEADLPCIDSQTLQSVSS